MNPVIAMVIGIALLIFLVMRTKIQAFPALIITAIVIGLLAGLNPRETVSAATAGFGSTLSSIGIVIGFGCIMGSFLEHSGAAKRMALSILKLVGVKRADVVLGISGFLVSIPVFCDSGFVILSQLAKELARLTRKSMVGIGGILAMGLYITHFLVPPTPGPLAVAGAFNVDLGLFIFWGILFSIPLFIVSIYLFRYFEKKHPEYIPSYEIDKSKYTPEQLKVLERIEAKMKRNEEMTSEDFEELLSTEKLPSAALSFAPIVVPLILIFFNTIVTNLLGIQTGPLAEFAGLIGSPVVALFVSVLIAVYLLAGSMDRESALKLMESAIGSAGLIVFVTGAGGALGNVIKVTGAGNMMAQAIVNSNIPVLFVPLLVGTLLRIPQGSGTTAMITGSSILAPMLGTLGLNPILAGMALCLTTMCPSYMNDSYFWVVTRFSGLDVKTSLKTWSLSTIIIPLIGSVLLFIASIFI
ncbi:MAG: GntP family permease [Firmicutes bacterium]|nr:GntP family permease [Bacillota bacterium]